jgi:SAM-dependent methyltransferase
MSDDQDTIDQPTFWREQGGKAWADNIATVEQQIADLSRVLLASAAPKPGEFVLDVGCGGGVTSKAVADAVGTTGRVLGVDVSDLILDIARRRFARVSNLRFESGDAQSMVLSERAYDLVLSRFGVMFFEDPVAAFKNLYSSLKRYGRLVFMCWREPAANPWMTIPVGAVFSVLGPPPPPDPEAPGPFAFSDPNRVHRILAQAGFADVGMERVDADVDLGSIDRAVKLMSGLGPAARFLAEASKSDRAQAIDELRLSLSDYATSDGLKLPASTWVVSATRAQKSV